MATEKSALVIGGTGPTGHFIVNGLLERGYQVVILHTGNHEVDEIPPSVEHIHTNPRDQQAVEAALAGRDFTLCIATYGRLRMLAEVMRDRCERFMSVGGQPCYVGYMNPMAFKPEGLPVPTAETARLIDDPALDEKGWRIVRTEQALFDVIPAATHFRYPIVYGAYQALPREWCIVKRILDGRPHFILPDGGLSLLSHGYAENLAHAMLLAVDQPAQSCGEIFNCADTQILTLRQMVEIIADAMGHSWRLVNMPWELAICARPIIMQPLSTHRAIDTNKLQSRLGYTDKVPVEEALARTARWLSDNPLADDSWEVIALQDPFDYAAEDQLVEQWDKAIATMQMPEYAQQPEYGMAYSGPGGRERSNQDFK